MNSNLNKKYKLAQQLLSWTDGQNIQIGTSQEHARTIAGIEQYMVDFFHTANQSKFLGQHVEQLHQLSHEDRDICARVVTSFVEEGILRPEIENPGGRYSRHDLYYALAHGEGSKSSALEDKKIAIIGVGGIGTNVATILSASGVGELLLVDDDDVELSNLTRQYLFREKDIGSKKVDVARSALLEKNSNVTIHTMNTQVNSKELLVEILQSVDLSIISADSSSNILKLANEASIETGKPFMPAGYQDTVGVVGPFFIPSNAKSTCLTCAQRSVSPDRDDYVSIANMERLEVLTDQYQAPSFGPLNLMVSSTSANEAIRYLLTGESQLFKSRAHIYLTRLQIELEEYIKDKNCPDCSVNK